MRVLIAEDEVFVAFDLQMQLENMGHEVVGLAMTTDETIELARAEKPDLVFLDLHLAHGSDGMAAARALRGELGIPCLVISASVHEITPAQREEMAFAGMLSKPVFPLELERMLAQIELS